MTSDLHKRLAADLLTAEGVIEYGVVAGNAALGATGTQSWAHTSLFITLVAVFKAARLWLPKVIGAQKQLGVTAEPKREVVIGGVNLEQVLEDVADANRVERYAPTVVLPESAEKPAGDPIQGQVVDAAPVAGPTVQDLLNQVHAS